MDVLAWIVGVPLIAMIMMAAMMKLTGHEMSTGIRDNLGVAEGLWKQIGGLEVAGGVAVFVGLLNVDWLGAIAGIAIVALTGGALVYHQRAGDKPKDMAMAAMTMMLAVVYVVAVLAR